MADVTPEVKDKPKEGACPAALADVDLSKPCVIPEKPNTAEDLLPGVTFDSVVSQGTPDTLRIGGEPALSGEAVAIDAGKLAEAVEIGNIQMFEDAMGNKNADDRRRIEAAYLALTDQPLDEAMRIGFEMSRDKVGYARAQALMDRVDGQTNTIGSVAVALEMQRTGYMNENAGIVLREALKTLSADEFQKMKKDWDARYGDQYGTFDQAMYSFSPIDRALVENFYSKGIDKRTAEDIVAAGNLIVDTYETDMGNLELTPIVMAFRDVVGEGTPASAAGLKALQADASFIERFNNYFGVVDETADALSEGKVSIATVAAEDPEGLETTLVNAKPEERQAFIEGRRLAAETGPLTPDQQAMVDYFKKLDRSFNENGDAVQKVVWPDLMENKKETFISALARKGVEEHTTEDLLSTIEDMSLEDWGRITPKDGKPSEYLQRLKDSIATYATDENEKNALITLLDAKAAARSYEASRDLNRGAAEAILANAGGHKGGNQAIADALLSISADDAAAFKKKYDTDPAFRQSINDAVFPKTMDYLTREEQTEANTAALVLSESLLAQVVKTGKPPQLTSMDIIARDIMEGKLTDTNARMQKMHDAMQDPALVSRLKAGADKVAQSGITTVETADLALLGMLSKLDPDQMGQPGFNALLNGEEIPLGTQMIRGGGRLSGESGYTDILKMTPEEQKGYEQNMTPDQQEIWARVKETGKFDDIDTARSYIVDGATMFSDVQANDYLKKLTSMSDTDRQKFLTDYKERYGSFGADLLAQAKEEGMDAGQLKLLEVVAGQDFKPRLEDQIRQRVLDGSVNAQDFIAQLSALSYTERQTLKTEYARKYTDSLDASFMAIIDNVNDKIVVGNDLTPAFTPAADDVVDRKIAGLGVSGADDSVERAVGINSELVSAAAAEGEELKQPVRDEVDRYVSDVIDDHKDTIDMEPPPPPPPMPNDLLLQLSVVKRGEGPWQTAERILASDGQRHNVDEVRALTKAIQQIYKIENAGNGDMSGLKVKHTFITKDNYAQLVSVVTNDNVRALLQSMAAAPAL